MSDNAWRENNSQKEQRNPNSSKEDIFHFLKTHRPKRIGCTGRKGRWGEPQPTRPEENSLCLQTSTPSAESSKLLRSVQGPQEENHRRGRAEKGWLQDKLACSDCSYELHERNIITVNRDWQWTIFLSTLNSTEYTYFFSCQYSTATAFLLGLREILPPLILFSSDNLRTEMAIISHFQC